MNFLVKRLILIPNFYCSCFYIFLFLFNLFLVQQNGPLEPTQEEQEDLERALEAVNKQVKSLQQMTAVGVVGGSGGGDDTTFLGDFLDVDDQMLDDTDICTEVVLNSPDTSGIDTSNILIEGGNNSSNSVGDEGDGNNIDNNNCHIITTTTATTVTSVSSDIRELVQA